MTQDGHDETGNTTPETRRRKHEAGNTKPETGNMKRAESSRPSVTLGLRLVQCIHETKAKTARKGKGGARRPACGIERDGRSIVAAPSKDDARGAAGDVPHFRIASGAVMETMQTMETTSSARSDAQTPRRSDTARCSQSSTAAQRGRFIENEKPPPPS